MWPGHENNHERPYQQFRRPVENPLALRNETTGCDPPDTTAEVMHPDGKWGCGPRVGCRDSTGCRYLGRSDERSLT
jgi:hypothetical protein